MRHATGAAGPTFKARTTGNGFGTAGFLTRGLLPFVMIACLSGGLFWFTAIYEGSLRDPRYLDGWLLAGGMGLQLFFHIGIKSGISRRGRSFAGEHSISFSDICSLPRLSRTAIFRGRIPRSNGCCGSVSCS